MTFLVFTQLANIGHFCLLREKGQKICIFNLSKSKQFISLELQQLLSFTNGSYLERRRTIKLKRERRFSYYSTIKKLLIQHYLNIYRSSKRTHQQNARQPSGNTNHFAHNSSTQNGHQKSKMVF
jgi:pyoverdine/dityrosine biosynthesis protein Dit1